MKILLKIDTKEFKEIILNEIEEKVKTKISELKSKLEAEITNNNRAEEKHNFLSESFFLNLSASDNESEASLERLSDSFQLQSRGKKKLYTFKRSKKMEEANISLINGDEKKQILEQIN